MWRTVVLCQCLLQRWYELNGDVNSTSGEDWKEPTSWTISTEASFNGDSKEETLTWCKHNLLAIIENKWDTKYIQILPIPTEGTTENTGYFNY